MPAQRPLGDDLLELAVGVQDLLPGSAGVNEGLQFIIGQPGASFPAPGQPGVDLKLSLVFNLDMIPTTGIPPPPGQPLILPYVTSPSDLAARMVTPCAQVSLVTADRVQNA